MSEWEAVEIERLLGNWQRYRLGAGGFGGLGAYAAYQLEQRGPRAESVMPLLAGEAADVDRLMRDGQIERKHVIVLDLLYLTTLPDHACAKKAGVSTRTWYRHIQAAKESFWTSWCMAQRAKRKAREEAQRTVAQAEQRMREQREAVQAQVRMRTKPQTGHESVANFMSACNR